MELITHRQAELEFLTILEYYRARRQQSAEEFADEYDATVGQILERPRSYPVVEFAGVRRARLRQFPYFLYFRELAEVDAIEIIAIVHNRRRQDYWLDRL